MKPPLKPSKPGKPKQVGGLGPSARGPKATQVLQKASGRELRETKAGESATGKCDLLEWWCFTSHLLSGWPKKSPSVLFTTKMVFPESLKSINSGSEYWDTLGLHSCLNSLVLIERTEQVRSLGLPSGSPARICGGREVRIWISPNPFSLLNREPLGLSPSALLVPMPRKR